MHLAPRYSRHTYAGGGICKRKGPVDGKFDDSGTLTKASNRHADPLVAVPMIVEFDQVRCKVSEWDVSGFMLETPLPGSKLGDVASAHVVLRVSDVDIGLDIPCQVVRETEVGAAEFKFLGAFTEQAAVLYRVAEDRLAGCATQFESLVCSQPLHQSGRKRQKFFLGARALPVRCLSLWLRLDPL